MTHRDCLAAESSILMTTLLSVCGSLGEGSRTPAIRYKDRFTIEKSSVGNGLVDFLSGGTTS